MIKINKPATAPAILAGKGKEEADSLCADFDKATALYVSGKLKFTFKSTIYAHVDVKAALIAAQHKKCCFCEFKAGTDGDVEHFRPKGGARQSTGQSLIQPGYYWLAYDWDNLLLCCSTCNQRFKLNLFPLADPAKRARSHSDKVADEKPLILNPAVIDPEEHIEFQREIPRPRNGSQLGTRTIKVLGLGREIINERRRDHLTMVEALVGDLRIHCSIDSPSEEIRKRMRIAARLIADFQSKTSAYTSMVRCAAADGNWNELVEAVLEDA